ncbi:MAG TPA: hypothetical protein VFV55_08530 [Usitatibacteraceae bacterium]|nr:hypothetical protein [Usitatibacteraceae bacterium]
MKRTAVVLAFVLGTTAAFAQAPAAPAAPAAPVVEPARCEPKPVYPGIKAIQDDKKREAFQQVLKGYQDCIKAYVAERKAFVEASNAAIRAAVEEHNAVMNKFREDQEAAKKELGQ